MKLVTTPTLKGTTKTSLSQTEQTNLDAYFAKQAALEEKQKRKRKSGISLADAEFEDFQSSAQRHAFNKRKPYTVTIKDSNTGKSLYVNRLRTRAIARIAAQEAERNTPYRVVLTGKFGSVIPHRVRVQLPKETPLIPNFAEVKTVD